MAYEGDNQVELTPALEEKINEWLSWDENSVTNAEVKKLRDTNMFGELAKLLLGRMEFGTAGLRGRMGPGYVQMNDLVIIQTTQGLASYIELCNKEKTIKEKGVSIGYDGRHNSRRFAELTASIFLEKGFTVYLFSDICPTPFVPFCVTMYNCLAGIMITASHNPKEDNGYKVYWNNGAQIIPPHDKLIQLEILKNLKPWENSWKTHLITESPLLIDPMDDVVSSYYKILESRILDKGRNWESPINITFTAMHGVGYRFMKEAFRACGFKEFIAVEEQKDPDPEFPTVRFPNPEEGKSALDLAIMTANKTNCSVILANDPDADRLAAAEKDPVTGKWHIFTGNELGALLGWWSFFTHRQKYPNCDLNQLYMLGSTVSTKFLQSMAKVEGFHFLETLTGFKWMGNKSVEVIAEGGTVLFAFEEAIGFMCGTAVLDKDGISAGAHTAELVAYLGQNNMTLQDKLHDLYRKYGHHISKNSYFLCYDPSVLRALFEKLRTFQGVVCTYPESIMGGKYKVTSVRDLTTGYDSSQTDKRAILPISSSSQMITFTFDNDLVTTLRTSGTEPKVKYYTELCGSPEQTDLEELHRTLDEMIEAIVQEFLKPKEHGLLPRTT